MPAPVYSERFWLSTRSSGTYQTEFTVPSGKRAIIRQLTYVDVDPGAAGGSIGIVAPGAAEFLIITTVPGGGGAHLEDLHLVFYAGENIRTYRVSGTIECSAHGYLLDAP